GVKGIPLRVQIETYEINYGGDHSGIGGGGRGGSDGSRGRIMEKSFAKIKLFRDKGAERKNKDDQKHLEKMWDKMRGKNADTNPLSQVLAPVQHVSLFWECPGDEEDYSLDENEVAAGGSSSDGNRDGDGDGGSSNQGDDGANREESSSSSSMDYFNQQQQGSSGGSADGIEYDDQQQQQDGMSKRRRMNDGRLDPNPSAGYRGSDFGGTGAGGGGGGSAGLNIVGSGTMVSSSGGGGGGGRLAAFGHTNTSNNNNSNDDGPPSSELLDRDPSYIPQQRRKKLVAMLCLYIKIGSESVYRAIYLERPTLHELLHKLCEKLEIQASTISGVFRRTTKKSLLVRADDAMVAQMPEELDMEVEYEFNQQDGSVNLTLKY
ncbi:grainyhead-like, partial [Mortierella sp. GBA35]